MRRNLLFLLALVALASFLPQSAYAGSGSWTRVSSKHGSKLTDEQIGLVRRSGGALGVAWIDHTGGKSALKLSTISAAGKFKGAKAIVKGWAEIGGPDAIPAYGGGQRIFFSGRKDTSEPSGLRTARSQSSSASFELEPDVLTTGDGVSDADIGAGVTADLDPIASWAGGFGVRAHYGLGPAENFAFQPSTASCCEFSPDIASEPGGGGTTIGWFSEATPYEGVYAAPVNPLNGSPTGTPMLMPGTKNASLLYSRTPITGRPSAGGTYMAYPSGQDGNEVRVWRVGSNYSTVLAKVKAGGGSINGVGIAADPKNRLWVFYGVSTIFGGKVYATRSDTGQKKKGFLNFAPPRKVALPKGGRIIDQLYGDAQSGKLDLVAKFRLKGTNSWWHRQVKP